MGTGPIEPRDRAQAAAETMAVSVATETIVATTTVAAETSIIAPDQRSQGRTIGPDPGAAAFTIGTAALDGRFPAAGPTLDLQLRAIGIATTGAIGHPGSLAEPSLAQPAILPHGAPS